MQSPQTGTTRCAQHPRLTHTAGTTQNRYAMQLRKKFCDRTNYKHLTSNWLHACFHSSQFSASPGLILFSFLALLCWSMAPVNLDLTNYQFVLSIYVPLLYRPVMLLTRSVPLADQPVHFESCFSCSVNQWDCSLKFMGPVIPGKHELNLVLDPSSSLSLLAWLVCTWVIMLNKSHTYLCKSLLVTWHIKPLWSQIK